MGLGFNGLPADLRSVQDIAIGSLPTWLRGKWGRAWAAALGATMDGLVQLAHEAALARFARHAPKDALEELGRDRSIQRYPRELESTYRNRLAGAFATHVKGGTEQGVVDQLAIMGYAAQWIRNAQWVVDGNSGKIAHYWARFWVLISNADTAGWGAPLVCGGGAICGDGSLSGVTGTTSDEVSRIFSTIRKWQPSACQLVSVIALVSGHVAGDGSLCGAGLLCGGTTVTLTG